MNIVILVCLLIQGYKPLITNPMLVSKRVLHQNYNKFVEYYVNTRYVYYNHKSILCEKDDLIQIGHIGLQKAVDNYDCNRGVAFQTYAICKIKWEIFNYAKKYTNLKKNVKTTDFHNFDIESVPDKVNNNLMEELFISDIKIQNILGKGTIESQIFYEYFGVFDGNPKTYTEIAIKYGISRMTVCKKINEKLKKIIIYKNICNIL